MVATDYHPPVYANLKAGRQWETVRTISFFIVAFFIFVEPNPTSRSWAESGVGGEVEGSLFQQILWPALFLLTMISVGDNWAKVFKQFDMMFWAMVAWFFYCSTIAVSPSISIRRLFLMLIVMFLFTTAISSFKSLKNASSVLVGQLFIATLYSYLYVVLFPQFGIHQATGLEPQLVGDWRGQYAHKNIAGAVYAAALNAMLRLGQPLQYIFAPLQFMFLYFTHDKTAIYMFVPIFLLSSIIVRTKSGIIILLMVAAPLVVLNLITLGSLYNSDLAIIAAKITGDSTFTGRTELWTLLINYIVQNPWHGAGFQSFWQIGSDSPAYFAGGTWTMKAFYGHQAFLDLAASVGLPGLFLGLWFAIVRPSLDIGHIANRRNPQLALYVSVWLLPLFQGLTESNLFDRAGAVWVMMLIAIAGIRSLRIEEQMESAQVYRALKQDRESARLHRHSFAKYSGVVRRDAQ